MIGSSDAYSLWTKIFVYMCAIIWLWFWLVFWWRLPVELQLRKLVCFCCFFSQGFSPPLRLCWTLWNEVFSFWLLGKLFFYLQFSIDGGRKNTKRSLASLLINIFKVACKNWVVLLEIEVGKKRGKHVSKFLFLGLLEKCFKFSEKRDMAHTDGGIW